MAVNTNIERATEGTLQRVLSALNNVKSAVDALTFDSDDVTITSPTDFPDAAANIKLQTVIDELQNVVTELQGSLAVTLAGNVNVGNFPSSYPNQHDQPLTDAELRLTDVGVDDGHPDPQQDALTDAELRATDVGVDTGLDQPLTDTQMRASPVKVDDDATQGLLTQIDTVLDSIKTELDTQQTDALTDAELRASAVPVDTGLTTQTDALTDTELRASRVGVEDKDTGLEVLVDQTGADGVLTFTFTGGDAVPWVYVDDGDPVRVTDSSQTPTASFGIPVASGSPFPVPLNTTTLKIYAATGQNVTVYGTR